LHNIFKQAMDSGISTMVELLAHHLMVEGSSSATTRKGDKILPLFKVGSWPYPHILGQSGNPS
jgi:hypothetical protein